MSTAKLPTQVCKEHGASLCYIPSVYAQVHLAVATKLVLALLKAWEDFVAADMEKHIQNIQEEPCQD